MAARVAEEKTREERKKQDLPDMDPRWQKVENAVNTQLKPTFKDLQRAVKERDEKLVQYLFERLLEVSTGIAKGLGMREFSDKLKTLEQKNFD